MLYICTNICEMMSEFWSRHIDEELDGWMNGWMDTQNFRGYNIPPPFVSGHGKRQRAFIRVNAFIRINIVTCPLLTITVFLRYIP